MKLSVHRYAEDFWDDSDYTEEQLDTDELKNKVNWDCAWITRNKSRHSIQCNQTNWKIRICT